jgi:glycogen operon protein
MALGPFEVTTGTWHRAGARFIDGGVNFCCFSHTATTAELLLFEHADSAEPFQTIVLDPWQHRTFFFWHLLVKDLPEGVFYGWRMDGPCDTARTGCRHDPGKLLLDPWASTVSDRLWDRGRASLPGDNVSSAMRAQIRCDNYDWEGDEHPHIALVDAVIYELHVGGFTRHHSAGAEHPGSFRALIDKIPYLQELGITHVELLPVMAFDVQDAPPKTLELGLENYWGYSTHSFFAPHPGYAVNPADARDEFRDMVKALHHAGIGVILDVVFNHTAEGGATGPLINFKGMDNEVFYHLDFDDRSQYRDYTGCGNTFNCNHPLVTRYLIDSLYFWAHDMHVDGFRFDLASAMARGETGEPEQHAPVLWSIELSPELARAHIIAEAWDAAGLYQVGDFPGYRWAEWNGRYRDVIRAFVRGDPGIDEVATRISGSSDLYQARGRRPGNSINFVTCHDGFTLNDLVSYNHKHNEANGEDNRDGHNDNRSWNCGVEGPTDDPSILGLRQRQAMNFMAVLMLSQGVPMILAGDEILRTQRGNNNSYCQNNELSWFDWGQVEPQRAMLEFTRGMIALRRRHPNLRRRHFLSGSAEHSHGVPDITWHGARIDRPPWGAEDARLLAFTLAARDDGEEHLHVIMNMSDKQVLCELPQFSGRHWTRAVDTADARPVLPPPEQPRITVARLMVVARSVMVFESRERAN